MDSIWASIRPGGEPASRAAHLRPAPAPPPTEPSPAMKAAVREVVGSDPEPRRPPLLRLGPALVEPPHPAIPPRAASVATHRRTTGWGYAIAWSLGIGVGAVAAGAFVGFLVNGPPGHSSRPRHVADVAPPTPDVPPPTAQEIVASKSAPTTAATAAPASGTSSASTASTAAPATSMTTATGARAVLPPIPPARPATQPPPASPPSPPLSAPNDIRELQGRLQSLGFDPGPIDGANGPKTAAAVTRYQQAHGLQPTGIADRDMLAELRHEPGAAPPPPPRPRAVQSYRSTWAPPRQSNPFLDALDRLFGR
ncbi:MAG: peptidoglycan-binding protein [Proteobacteria bacterium]|nr:peptidoglycan-binding protein [Pseudomonadota bacterium]